MNIFRKIKNFVRRIFVDYGAIDRMIEEKSRNYSDNIINVNSKNIEHLTLELKQDFNHKISDISERINNCYDKIDRISNENNNNKFEIQKELSKLQQYVNQYKYCNSEIQGIANDKKKKNILIVGFYGAPNLGDELMLETILDYLENIDNKEIMVMIADNPNYNIDKYKDVKFIHYPLCVSDFNILADKYDYIVFGGGAIIDDTQYQKEKSYQYDLGTILIKLAIRAIAFHKKVVCIGLSSCKHIKNDEYLKKLRHIIENSTIFTVRDKYTKNYLKEVLGEDIDRHVLVTNDIVFSNKEIRGHIRKCEDILKEKKNIGIVYISNDNNKEKLKLLIKSVKSQIKDARINLIPFYDYDNCDTKFYKAIQEEETDCNVEKYPENMEELISIYKKNDIIIGMRYHAILLAYIFNIPCIPICYDIHEHYLYKVRSINELFNKTESINYSTFTENDIVGGMKHLSNEDFKNKYELCNKIIDEAEEEMNGIVKNIFKL
ncbi:MAG: polysaccharide pyruvyl transferase family protein [Clostridia bacterium]|nr:polysaccharide pyruvyl transferase family protein [Clostridia bacterium]